MKKTFERAAGTGLILGSALGYALKELWTDSPDRRQFWSTCVSLISHASVDPLARSVVARLGCELPETVSDVEGFIHELNSSGNAYGAFHAIVSALSVRTQNEGFGRSGAAWAHLAAAIGSRPEFSGLLNHLLFLLTKDAA